MNQANPNQLTIGVAHRRFKTNPFSKTGRMSRSEFFLTAPIIPWGIQIICFILLFLGAGLTGFLSTPTDPSLWPFLLTCMLTGIIQIALVISLLGYGIRRLHDMGNSGWWLWINLIPVIGQAIILYKFLQASNPGDNKYGQQPLETQAINPDVDENQLGLWRNLLTIIKSAFHFKGRTSRHELTLGFGFLYLVESILSIALGFIVNGLYILSLIDIFQKAPFLLGNSQIIEMYMVQEYGTNLAFVGGLYSIIQLLLFLISLTFIAAMVRRLHDVGKSGYYILLPIILSCLAFLTLIIGLIKLNTGAVTLIFPILCIIQCIVSLYVGYLLIQPSSTNTKYGPILPAFQEPTNNSSELVDKDEDKANTTNN